MAQYDLPRSRPRIELKNPPTVASGAQPVPLSSPTEPSARGMDIENVKRAFLKTVAKGEAPEGGYDYMLGGGRFTDFSRHPNILNNSPYGASTAAGQYQFLHSTWDEQAKKYGYKDFKPETQDTAAWNYARDVYYQKTGRKLEDDLQSANPTVLNNISKVLGPTWTSLPGGPQPNKNWAGQNFADVYTKNLSGVAADPALREVVARAPDEKAADPLADPEGNTGRSETPKADGEVTSTSSASASAGSTTTDTSSDKPKEKEKDYKAIAGDALADLGKGMADGPIARNARTASTPANVAMASLPPAPGPQSMVDPRMVEMQRQQLAMAMKRLNSGKLI